MSRSKHLQVRPGMLFVQLMRPVSAVAPSLRPRLQTAFNRTMYSILGMILREEDSPFLNYGYTPLDTDGKELRLSPDDEADRFAIQLYFRVAGAQNLRGKNVLEIGCGRGGGASFIARYLHPASMTGIDLSARAVRYCRRRRPLVEGLTFLRGEAENVPLPSQSFDAVVNVESSHCYPSFDGFVTEVTRLLRPGGFFLFADLRPRHEVALLRDQLSQRFTIVEEEFITPNVVQALKLDSDRRNQLIQKRAPRFLQEALRVFAGVHGTPTFDSFASGALQYVRFVCAKRP